VSTRAATAFVAPATDRFTPQPVKATGCQHVPSRETTALNELCPVNAFLPEYSEPAQIIRTPILRSVRLVPFHLGQFGMKNGFRPRDLALKTEHRRDAVVPKGHERFQVFAARAGNLDESPNERVGG